MDRRAPWHSLRNWNLTGRKGVPTVPRRLHQPARLMMSCADFMKHFDLLALLAAALAGSGCKKESAPGATGRPPGGFAVQAVVIEARAQAVSESLSLVGTVAANEIVEIKSETDGTVEKILVTEG